MKVLATNRRATFDYTINERLVAGLVLQGHEAKSARAGNVSLKGSFIQLKNGEAYLQGAHFTPYAHADATGIDPTRTRKLLLHERQLHELQSAKDRGEAIVPTALLLGPRHIKLEIGIGPGKKRYDKRSALKARDSQRETARELAKFRPGSGR